MNHGPESTQEHRLLLVTGHRYLDTCRLALAARAAGFDVYLLGPKNHPISALDWVIPVGAYSALRPGRSVATVLNAKTFQVVVPVDDLGASAVFDAYLSGALHESASRTVLRSLGDPASFAIRHERAAVGNIASMAGLAAPATWSLPSEDALTKALDSAGFPVVLKVDGGFSGQHVKIVDGFEAAREAYGELSHPPQLANSVGRLVLDHDGIYVRSALTRKRPVVSAQEFVPGELAILSGVARAGELLGFAGYRALRTWPGNGPATVIEPLSHPDLERAARVIASTLGLSGMFGLDFVLSPDGSSASLIELNPRATPTSHLQPDTLQRPLFHLLADSIGLDSPPPRPPLPPGPIALFPQSIVVPADGIEPEDVYLDLPEASDVVELCTARTVPVALGRLDRMIRRIF